MMIRVFTICLALAATLHADDAIITPQHADGYNGIWYQNQPLNNAYTFKYSGGLGTYCAKHNPFAVYAPKANKTFFVYGGAPADYHTRTGLTKKGGDLKVMENALLHMVSYFDHDTGQVPYPAILLDKHTSDAHDNPVISIDDDGHIWVLSTAHGNMRPAYIHKSTTPYSIDSFRSITPRRMQRGQQIPVTNFSYMQAWHIPDRGFVYFFTKYEGPRRNTCFATSKDGETWNNWTQLADMEGGHYQISAVSKTKAASAFNMHPNAFNGDKKKKGLNWRTNLYYIETSDFGQTWQTANGIGLTLPVADVESDALVYNFEKEGRLVYLKDLVLDSEGQPIILFITSKGYVSGPASGPRDWNIARWTGKNWSINRITSSDSNYDMGSLYVEDDNTLRIIAPTEVGPQVGNPGGEIAAWISKDSGKTWSKESQLTANSSRNHTYLRRPVNAHPDFYGLWADGHGRQPSPSRLYFCNKKGDVFELPAKMTETQQAPVKRQAHP